MLKRSKSKRESKVAKGTESTKVVKGMESFVQNRNRNRAMSGNLSMTLPAIGPMEFYAKLHETTLELMRDGQGIFASYDVSGCACATFGEGRFQLIVADESSPMS